MHTASAPLEIGRVALTVHDLGRVGAFYETALGLERISADGASALYGAGGRVLLELRADPAARRSSPREAGLFHTAFLMPDRAALGRWLHHVAATRVPLQGSADHLVSEALYLADPEGNGIEVYVDRPRDRWQVSTDGVKMATEALDIQELAAAADGPWQGAPAGMVVGHVHLQVGSLPAAESFYHGQLGFAVTSRYPGALFYGAGGYHHHLATNIWNSRAAGPRDYPATGLAEVEIRADPDLAGRLAPVQADPWGTRIRVAAKGA
ncbi:VOC family protein [Ruixingdingia sedimenti]|uniref:VOC family protein n=1 Tax=Ruixingdingia sedimenti TaxID=3073604 RepID=A0ABU1F4A7_9RHOB|nr:VOC family protein [Xinfangfangia sp. LG-4]MDR5651503.1 VOC family protein [Xinfangfangia sp. LG-4]